METKRKRLTKEQKREQAVIDLLNQMFIIAGHNVTYEDIKGRKDNWWTEWTMTMTQADEWKAWGVNYLRKNLKLNKALAEKEMQWDGYNVRLSFGTGQSQVRRILYNDTTTLTVADTNYQAVDSFNNTGFSSVSPYTTPTSSAGSQTHFVIESTELTVNTAWVVTPDASSIYQIMTGGIWVLSSSASTPFATWQYYDPLLDCWFNKTTLGPAPSCRQL